MVEAEFLLDLLVSLFADPARLDGRGEGFESGVGGEVGQIVVLFAEGAPLADEPNLVARHMLHAFVADPLRRSVGDAHANRGEAGFQKTLRSLAPTQGDTLERQPFPRVASLAADEGAGFLKIMDWMVDKLREAPAAAA